ncbi:MAG: DUF2189 domain-containing protein [Pseudomonadota bacterium]|jgi:uncharacterized membrane protein
MDGLFDNLTRHFALSPAAHVPVLRPFQWLGKGWEDLRSAPLASLGYGLAITAVWALVLMLGLDRPYLFTAAISGFLLVAPLLAVGLYELSRRRAAGESVRLRDAFRGWRRNTGALMEYGLLLAIVFIAWERLSAILFALLYGGAVPDLQAFVHEVFLSGRYPLLVTAYVLAGGLLAALMFALSVASVPLLMERNMDIATAMMNSLRAVVANPLAMLLWAALIVALTAVGFATALAGMVVVMPLLGHASWHAYKELMP